MVLVVALGVSSAAVPSGAITGGTAIPADHLAESGRLGWLVRLESDTAGRCTGALVHAEWVLTAAHCAEGTIEAFVGDAQTATATLD